VGTSRILCAVIAKLQVAVLPLESVVPQVSVVVPIGGMKPDGGTHAVVAAGQLSTDVGAKLAGEREPAGTVRFAGHVITGGWVSLIVTVKTQVAPPGVSVQVLVVVPTGKKLPEGGVQVMVPQVPVVVGAG
jgi:hypothetical protein